jgi:hypothetical protein
MVDELIFFRGVGIPMTNVPFYLNGSSVRMEPKWFHTSIVTRTEPGGCHMLPQENRDGYRRDMWKFRVLSPHFFRDEFRGDFEKMYPQNPIVINHFTQIV